MENNGIPRWVQNKINKLEQRKLTVRPEVAKNMQREIDQLSQKYINKIQAIMQKELLKIRNITNNIIWDGKMGQYQELIKI